MPIVELSEVVVLLGRFPALAGATLQVDAGESVLLQGPNGAGKSTLLRLCAGLLRPERGSAIVLGQDLYKDRRAVRNRIGYVGHQSMLYDDLTVEENIRFWGRASGVEQKQQDAAVDRLEIEGRLLDVPVSRLSAGQRRRTAIAVAAARRPELWLLDEPHAGLDQSGRDIVDALITDAAAAGGAVLVASHELDRVEPVVDRRVTIAGGTAREEAVRITASGPAGPSVGEGADAAHITATGPAGPSVGEGAEAVRITATGTAGPSAGEGADAAHITATGPAGSSAGENNAG